MKVHNKLIKAFGALLIAALLFGAMPTQAVLADVSEVRPALQAGADRLVSLQNDDGGWDWELDDGDPTNVSPQNTIGPIGIGLAQAHLHTGDSDHYAALQKVGTFLLSKTTFSGTDGILAAQLDKIFGVTTYTEYVNTNFYDKLANNTYVGSSGTYSTSSYIQYIRNVRSGKSANLAAWDLGYGLVGAAECGVTGTELQYWIDGVKAEINELDDYTDTPETMSYFTLGLAGALYGLSHVNEDIDPTSGYYADATNIGDLFDGLLALQNSSGGFVWHPDYTLENDQNENSQATAYALLALDEYDRANYLDEMHAAADYMLGIQLATGGWDNYPAVGTYEASGENNEVTAEAMWAISVAYPELWVCPTGDCGHPGAQFTTIQGAIDASVDGTIIYVAAGTFVENLYIAKDLTIQGAGAGNSVIQSPDTLPVCFTSSADNKAIVCIEDAEVNLDGFTIDGAGKGNANYRFVGVAFHNAGGTLQNSEVLDIRDTPFSGSQHGNAVYAFNEDTISREINVQNNVITGFQKTGIALNASDTTPLDVLVDGNTVTGIGPTSVTAQNGIQVWALLGTGTVSNNEVSGIYYVDPDDPAGENGCSWVASTILNYYADLAITDNALSDVQIGVYHYAGNGLISGNDISAISEDTCGTEGILAFNYAADGSLEISDNSVTMASGGVESSTYGIDVLDGAYDLDVVINGNEVSGFDIGISLWDDYDVGTLTSMTVTYNILNGNELGFWPDTLSVEPLIEYNQFLDGESLRNDSGFDLLDASPNWWGSILGPEVSQISGVNTTEYSPWCGDAECTFLVPDEEIVFSGTITEPVEINNPGVTIFLEDNTVIDTGGPCFIVNASDTRILTESPGGAVCYPGSPGIQVYSGATNVVIEGLEIDGQGTADGNGIDFLGAVTDVIISDNHIHDMVGNGVNFAAAPGGYVEITGNLFKDNSLVGVEAPADLDVRYNAWGSYDGPTEGDGISTNITNYSPWTHVDVYVADGIGSRYVNEVALGEDPAEEITYNVYANLQNAYGAQFTLSFDPAKLQVLSTSTDGTVFPWPFDDGSYTGTELTAGVTVDSINGKITFNGGAITAVSGEDQFLFSVTFEGVAPTDVDNPLFFDEADIDLYGMNPTFGSSLNIYAAGMEGVADVNVYVLPTLTIDPLATFAVGNVKEFTLTVTNPATGRAYTDLNVDLVVPTGATLEYWDGTAWVEYVDGVEIGELAIDATADVLFRIVFAAVTPSDVTVTLNDGTVFLVEDTFTFIVLDAYTVTGTVQMQGRTERAGVLVALSNATEYGYDTLSTNIITDNYTLLNVADGTYDLSITHDRYLDFTYTGLVLTSDILDLTRLELRGGDVEKDNLIDIFDASLVGLNYGSAGNNAADANFDGTVNIQDLAMIGGNFDLQSTDSLSTNYAYGTWAP